MHFTNSYITLGEHFFEKSSPTPVPKASLFLWNDELAKELHLTEKLNNNQRTLAEYFHSHRLRLSFIVDAAIVFILRDIMMLLYMKDYNIKLLYLLTVMLLVLGVMRTGCIYVFRHELLMMEKIQNCLDGHSESSK